MAKKRMTQLEELKSIAINKKNTDFVVAQSYSMMKVRWSKIKIKKALKILAKYRFNALFILAAIPSESFREPFKNCKNCKHCTCGKKKPQSPEKPR